MKHNSKYREYLESDKWKSIKKKVINRDGGKCQGCFSELPLDVHHLTYDRIGAELMMDLISLCRECHDSIHSKPIKTESKDSWHFYIKGYSSKKPINVSDMTKEELYARNCRILRDGI